MISATHRIELFVNGHLMELIGQDSLGMRITNVLFDPTKTSTTQAEYSYSFDIPSTPSNDKVLGYANVLSQTNKFHTRYSAQVYADGTLIFDGSMTIEKYSYSDKVYECHLVSIKVNSLDEIFGEAKLSDIPWEVDFDGASTINSVNGDLSTDYWFPFVSQGVFQKEPYHKDEVANDYTSKFIIDEYNKFWIETFYPSLNVMALLRKAFEWKGYSIGGSAFADPWISSIYASTNLAEDQIPAYNLGNPKFGSIGISATFDTDTMTDKMTTQELTFPYMKVVPAINAAGNRDHINQTEYNFTTIDWWNCLQNVTSVNDNYLYEPNEHLIVIPHSGWYRILMTAEANLKDFGNTFQTGENQWKTTYVIGDPWEQVNLTLRKEPESNCPVEVQLIRNYDANIELIKGKKNIMYDTGDPNQESYSYAGKTWANKHVWETEYPHQDLYGSYPPTKTDVISDSTLYGEGSGRRGRITVTESTTSSSSRRTDNSRSRGGGAITSRTSAPTGVTYSMYNTNGYIHPNSSAMPYDQVVSPSFICGFSSFGGTPTVSVMRNGYSWSRMCSIKNEVFANVQGMNMVTKNGNVSATTPTDYCKNTYTNAPANVIAKTNSGINGRVAVCVWLEKDDILEPVVIQRDYDGKKYGVSGNVTVQLTAITDKNYASVSSYMAYTSPVEYSNKLNLTNFCSNETLVRDWVDNVLTAFNLEMTENGNIVDVSTKKGIKKTIDYAVDIDNRVSNSECETEIISYPRSMSVRWSINTDEYGFERSVPYDHINDFDWEKYGDSGYTVIQLSDDSYETSENNTNVQFSYCWYEPFELWRYNQQGSHTGTTNLYLPVIELSQYMADGYGYEEAMKHDGASLTQRFWYRQAPSQNTVRLSHLGNEQVSLSIPVPSKDGMWLSFKDNEMSLLTEYFNFTPLLSSNYVNVDVYLNPEEFEQIKGGALVRFNKDLHWTSEIQNYDPSGYEPTTLKLIKKV